MSTISDITPPPAPPAPPSAPAADDPFRYGWREVPVMRSDGTRDFERVPLTLEDVLHPQLGDVMPQSTPHDRDTHYLKDVYAVRVADDPTAVVFHDVIIDWHDPELRHHSPDITVLFGVRDPDADRNSFDVVEEGVRPTVLTEVVSPAYRNTDVETKVEHYHRARVPWYIIVDRERVEGPVRLIGYRYRPASYERLAPDEHGRLWLQPLRLWLGTEDNRVVCYDETGRELGDYARISQELDEALDLAEKEKERAEKEAERANKEKDRADREKERADKEKDRAHKEKDRADRALDRAEKEKDRAEKEKERADKALELADKERARADKEAHENAELARRVRQLEEEMSRRSGGA